MPQFVRIISRFAALSLFAAMCLMFAGCGSTQSRTATSQLVVSDAVDDSVSRIDFTPLAGEKVYFDTTYIRAVKDVGFVNSDYIISSMRQQMVAARCLLQERRDDADVVVEARVGALGSDEHTVVFGIPASSGLSQAASVMTNVPAIPAIPEISFARRFEESGAAKVAAFAYLRETGEPIWQSGINPARSTSRDTWVFGVGPFQKGDIHEETTFAGNELKVDVPLINRSRRERDLSPLIDYKEEVTFHRAPDALDAEDGGIQQANAEAPAKDGGVQQASFEAPVKEEDKKADASSSEKKADDK